MKIYNAIMKAADHVERNPKDFNFCAINIPTACGTPGCALGWIGHFLGVTQVPGYSYSGIGNVAANEVGQGFMPKPHETPLGVFHDEFYRRMTALADGWMFDASICAHGLRRYAETYHAEAPKAAAPDWNIIASSPLIPEHVKSEEVVS